MGRNDARLKELSLELEGLAGRLSALAGDPRDRRLVRLALTPSAVAGIEAYLAAVFERRFLLP